MSSTNRNSERAEHDYYKTPVREIENFLNEFKKIYGYNLHFSDILDPCAGGDDKSNMSYPEALKTYTNRISTIDIREDSRADLKADYLETDCKNKYGMIITNPPFNLAMEIIKKSIDDVKAGGLVVMLLRLNFFGSKKRKHFWEKYMPEYTFVHHERMSFTNNGKTDSIEYCHMVWRKGYNPEFTLQKVI